MSSSITSLGGTSNTFSFQPSASQLILYAYARCGIRGPQLQAEHMRDAVTALNMIQSDWANDQVNLWTVELITVPLVFGQIAYPVPENVILILDAYLEINPGTSAPIDLYMYPISRTEYAAFPNKVSPGRPTTYWFDRTLTPVVNLWQPPDDASQTFNYYACRQIQDVGTQNGQQPEIPYPWLKAFSDALSVELAMIYAPDKVQMLQPAAMASYKRAKAMGAERSALFLFPGINNYFR
jgi:hypothetical protein